MKFSENWLRELVEIKVDRDALTRALTMAGLEVEDQAILGEGLDGVVVAEIVAATKHPEADRLQLCSVDVGQAAPLQIVCGAPNARVGLKAPLAMVGAQLPGGVTIKAAKLRGVESSGMLCSAKELGVDADASGLWELPHDAPVGQPLATYLGLPDASIELSLTPNRSDCLSMQGLAYDVAALFGGALHLPESSAVPVTGTGERGIRLEAGKDAPRYLGRVVEGVDPTAQTPWWLAERLRRAGVRPISAIVDVTNYVMLELGQPMHAFDNDKLQGDVVVRHVHDGEALKLLDGSTVKFARSFPTDGGQYADDYDKHVLIDGNNKVVMIADEQKALAVAGVMGGFDARVTDSTRNILLEAAHFAPAAIMGRARKLGLHTEASHRFERGVDPELPRRALERASELLLSIAGGSAGPVLVAEHLADLPQPTAIELRRARLARVLGVAIDDAEVVRIFTALDMKIEACADGWLITAPSRRFDIEREEDLIEEAARIFGYDNIPTRTPGGALSLQSEPETRLSEQALREQLAARGFYEAINLSFVAEELLQRWGFTQSTVKLANPLSADLAVMRPSLLPGLVEALVHNTARQQDRVRLFEIAKVFAHGSEPGSSPRETTQLAIAGYGPARAEQWGESARAFDFYDIKGELDALIAWGGQAPRWSVHADGLSPWLHPGRAARIVHDGETVGYLGALHPHLARQLDLAGEVQVLELALDAVTNRRLPVAEAISRFPLVRRDIAVDLPESVSWAEVERTVRAALGSRLTELRLFDRYSGKGVEQNRKSLAMGLILQDTSRTLTDDDAANCVRLAVAALETTCMAKLRG